MDAAGDAFSIKKTRSSSPKGKTMPIAKERLDVIKAALEILEDPEHILMDLWAKENTRKTWLNYGAIPLDHILHRCNKKCRRLENGGMHHHFDGKLKEREVQVAAATVQWLATNCGRAVLHEFSRLLHERDVRRLKRQRTA